MSIAKMLEYQKIDRELYYLEKEFSNLPEIQKYSQIQNSYKEKMDSIPKLTKELDDIVVQLNELLKRIDELEKNKTNLESDVNTYTATSDFETYDKLLTGFEDEINNINRESSRLYKRMGDIGYDNKRTLEQVDTLQNQGAQVKRVFLGKQQEMRVKATPIVKKLQAITDIDAAMMAKYKASRDAKVYPVFVPYTDEGNCSACGMFVKIEVDKHLTSQGDYIECPHCRRVLYKR